MRRSPPQPPMIRYIGTSSASKNTKNSSRSSATNEPSTAVSSTSIDAMKSRTFFVDRPRRQHRQREQERGQQHHPEADAVDADQVLQPDALHPRGPLHQLEPGVGPFELAQDRQRDDERDQRGEHGERPRRVVGQRRRHTIKATSPTRGRNVTIVSRWSVTAGTPRRRADPIAPARNAQRVRADQARLQRCGPRRAERRNAAPIPFTMPSMIRDVEHVGEPGGDALPGVTRSAE